MMNLLIATAALALNTIAGPISSGGGMAVKCTNGNSETYQVLDYFETQSLHENVARASGDFVEDYKRLATRTYWLQGASIDHNEMSDRNLELFFEMVDWVNASELGFLADHGDTLPISAGCELVQLAIFYDGSKRVKIARDIWEKLDSMNKASLIMHELWYYFERDYSELNSLSSRAYVRQMLAAEDFTPVNEGKEGADLHCSGIDFQSPVEWGTSTVDYSFYVHNGENSSVLQLSTIAERSLLVKATAQLDFRIDTQSRLETSPLRHVSYPTDPSVSHSVLVDISTEHLEDMKLRVLFQGGSPLSVQAFIKNRALGPEIPVHCSEQ